MNDQTSREAELLSLLELARQAALNAYAPYSGFRVGAALRLTNGEIVTGGNVENVSYGLTICAERSAVFQAIARAGGPPRIRAALVYTPTQSPTAPCGACRQVFAEFILPEAPVIFPAAEGLRTMTFQELLPVAFDMKLK